MWWWLDGYLCPLLSWPLYLYCKWREFVFYRKIAAGEPIRRQMRARKMMDVIAIIRVLKGRWQNHRDYLIQKNSAKIWYEFESVFRLLLSEKQTAKWEWGMGAIQVRRHQPAFGYLYIPIWELLLAITLASKICWRNEHDVSQFVDLSWS